MQIGDKLFFVENEGKNHFIEENYRELEALGLNILKSLKFLKYYVKRIRRHLLKLTDTEEKVFLN